MSISSKLARIIGVLTACVALVACSAIKLSYNNIDEIAYWWLDGYIDFENSQTPRVREDLARLHLWHRSTELPRYGEVLRRMEQLAPTDVTPAQVCGFAAEIRERLTVVAERAEPSVVTLALDLTGEQLQQLERKYQKNNADYRKEWIDPSAGDLHDKRFKQALERGETLYGRLSDAQRALLRKRIEQSTFDTKLQLAQRQRRQQDALQTLRKVAGQPVGLTEARDLMRAYLARTQTPANPAERTMQETMLKDNCANIAALHNATTPAQREHAMQRLRGYQNDVQELTARR